MYGSLSIIEVLHYIRIHLFSGTVVLAASYGTNFQNTNSLTVANINAIAITVSNPIHYEYLTDFLLLL
jgi:hypothetical protein